MHEVVRKDKYSKEDVTTPAEPVLTSRFVRVVNEMLCLLDTARSTELRMVPGRARRELLVLAAAWGRKAGEAVAPYLTERSQVATSKTKLNNKSVKCTATQPIRIWIFDARGMEATY